MSDQVPTVLVVDDSALSRRKLSAAVQALGHRVEEAENGAAGLERLRQGGVDLLLLDIVMPEMDGFGVLEAMNEEGLMDIPVLVISSVEEMSDIVRAIEMGATDFLPKQVNPMLLRARVDSCLEKKRHRDKELVFIQDVHRLTRAAQSIQENQFGEAITDVDTVAARHDELGNLARMFGDMATEIRRREESFRKQIDLLRGSFLLIMIGVSWGLAPSFSKIFFGDAESNPIGMSAWIATNSFVVTTFLLILTHGVPRIDMTKVKAGLLLGLIGGALPQVILFYSAQNMPAIVLSIILATESLIVFAIATVLRMENPTVGRLLGLLFGFIGVAVIIVPTSSGGSLTAPIWVFVALLVPLSYAIEGIAILAFPTEKMRALEFTSVLMAGSVFWGWMLALVSGQWMPVSELDLVSIGQIASFSSISIFASWLVIVAVRTTGAVFASQSGYVITIMGVIWSMLLLGETLSSLVWIALACILCGMVLVRPKDDVSLKAPA